MTSTVRKSKIELLAPAGSEEALHAAIENGADAVYFGLSGVGFNARVRAQNIPLEKLGETMSLLHRRGVKGYVTLNTLVRNEELPGIESLLVEIVQAGADAIIVQDFGVAVLAGRLCPELPVHASTQMSLCSAPGIESAGSLGIRRVVLPRELSLEQIGVLGKTFSDRGIELECFVHGALCISFSGQCYASLTLGGRSANRGCCAQPCRIPYTLLDGQTDMPLEGFESPGQLLSPCDLAGLPLLSKLVGTGIRALKIEGRLKPPEYVAEATRIHRNALDRLAGQGESGAEKEELNSLGLTFSRGFSTGWLEGVDPPRLVPGHVLAHRGTDLGTVIEVRRDAVVARLTDSVRRGDGVLIENAGTPERSQGGRVYEIFRHKKSVPEAEAGAKVLLTFANGSIDATFAKAGQSLRKTDDPKLRQRIRRSLRSPKGGHRIPLEISVRAVVGEPLRLDVRTDDGVSVQLFSDEPLRPASKHPASGELFQRQFDRLGETVYSVASLDATIEGDPMVPLSVLGQLRKRMVAELDEARTRSPNPSRELLPDALERIRGRRVDQGPKPESEQTLHLLLRDLRRFEDDAFMKLFLDAGFRSFYAELRDWEDYRRAEKAVRAHGAELVVVLPRILKPGEVSVLKRLARLRPDGVLARNLEGIAFFHKIEPENRPTIIADFSLNVVNDLSFRWMLDQGADRVTPGWDLGPIDREEWLRRVPTDQVERIVVGRVPLFSMEHCLWRANLVPPGKPCDRLCRTRPLKLRDRRGAIHSVRTDLLCRNYVENSAEIEPEENLAAWRHLRVEWDDRIGDPAEMLRSLGSRLEKRERSG